MGLRGRQRRARKTVVQTARAAEIAHDALTQCQGEGPFVMASPNPTGHDRLQRSAANQELPSLTDA